MDRISLEEYALRMAIVAAGRSQDPKRQVGAIVLGIKGEILASGYNGPPAGIDLTDEEWADRDVARALTIHAEVNALRWIKPGTAVLLASTYGPCGECVKMAAAAGIDTIVYRVESGEIRQGSAWIAERLGIEMRRI